MHPNIIWLVGLCIVLYSYNYKEYCIYNIPLWSILLTILIILYFLNNKKEHFESTPRITLYNFNTLWCGYSRRFNPEWAKLDELLKKENINNVDVIDVKCDDTPENVKKEENNKLAEKYKVPGFPYIVILDYNNNFYPYTGPRSATDIVDHVKKLLLNGGVASNVNADNFTNETNSNSGNCSA